MSRISTLGTNTEIINQLLRTQQRLLELQAQVSSEKKSQIYAGIAPDAQRLVNLENTRDQLSRFVSLNDQEATRVDVTLTVLDSLQTSVRDFRNDLSSFKQQGAFTAETVASIQDSAFRALRDLEDLLNTEVDGRYLFSGGRATSEPIDFGVSSVAAFQAIYDGARVIAPTTRDAHLERFSFSEDATNRDTIHIDSDNFLQFRRDGDGVTTNAGSSTIRATSALFSNVTAGATITVSDTASNDGTYTVSSVSSDGTTITVRTEMLTDETLRDSLATEAPAGAISFLLENNSTLTSGAGDISFDASTGTITDSVGTLFSGLSVGAFITVSGSGSNNATFKVAAVNGAGTQITIAEDPTVIEAADGSARVLNANTGQITFDRANDTITAATAGAFSDFSAGMTFTVSGSDENDGTYTVASVSSDGTTLTIKSKKLTDEGLSGTSFFDYYSDTDVEFTAASSTIEVRQSGTATPVANIFKGLAVGDQITVAGTGSNNTTFTIASIASDYSSVTVDEAVTDETDTDGATFTGSGNAFSYTSGTQMVFTDVGAAGTDTIQLQDSGGGALSNAFSNLKVGETFTISGTLAHDGTYTIKSISGDGSTVTVDEDITATATDSDGARIQVFAADGTIAANPYFQGDQQSLTHRVDRDRDYAFDLNGASPAFEKAIRAIKLILQGTFGTEGGLDQNTDRVDQALYLLASSLDQTVEGTPPFGTEESGSLELAAQDVGFNRFLLQEVNARHKSLIGFLDASAADAENADPLEAITRLLDDQRALEASYQAFARIRSLSLLDFL